MVENFDSISLAVSQIYLLVLHQKFQICNTKIGRLCLVYTIENKVASKQKVGNFECTTCYEIVECTLK